MSTETAPVAPEQANQAQNISRRDQPTPLVAISYAFQRYEIESQTQQIPLLLSANRSSSHQLEEPTQNTWCVATAGTVSHRSLIAIKEAIMMADIDHEQRCWLTPMGPPLEEALINDQVNDETSLDQILSQSGWQHSLSAQITSLSKRAAQLSRVKTSFDGDATSLDVPALAEPSEASTLSGFANSQGEVQVAPRSGGHLLLIVSSALESISPRIRSAELDHFSSVTMLMECTPDRVLSWHRWNTALGGTMLKLDDQTTNRLADRFQRASRGMRRMRLSLTLRSSFTLMGVTQLTPQIGPLPIDSREQGKSAPLHMWAELPLEGDRWSALFMVKYTGQKISSAQQSLQEVARVSLDTFSAPLHLKIKPSQLMEVRQARNYVQSQYINSPLGGGLPVQYDQIMLGVAFAQQLSHRVRVIDNLLLSLLRRDPRKPSKLLDQLVKITAALNAPEQAQMFRDLKLEFLAVGELPTQRWDLLVSALLHSTHRLSNDGQWTLTPPIFG